MPITKRKCRVCGKEYEACRTNRKEVGGFNWKEVACSPECGTEYLRRVQEARNPSPKVKQKPAQKTRGLRAQVSVVDEAMNAPVRAEVETVHESEEMTEAATEE